jgi:hypothetical protein
MTGLGGLPKMKLRRTKSFVGLPRGIMLVVWKSDLALLLFSLLIHVAGGNGYIEHSSIDLLFASPGRMTISILWLWTLGVN